MTKSFKTPYKIYTIKLMTNSEYFEDESDNLIEFIKKLKHTDILNFNYEPDKIIKVDLE